MYYKNGKITLRMYWKLNWKIENKSESYYLKKLNKLLISSVELRLQSDVHLRAFLSGGVDSSLNDKKSFKRFYRIIIIFR